MIYWINFLKKIGFGRGKLKKFNSKILTSYIKRKNINSLEQNYYGKKFILFPLENTSDNKIIISSKKYEHKELEFLKNLKKNNESVFLDIGANMGYYSIMSSNLGFKKIFAFEPVPRMVKRIQKHIEINNLEKLIKVVPYAVGEKTKKISFYEEPLNYGGSSLFQATQRSNKIIVEMITLNHFIIKNSISHIDALKIDVEGYEDKVLFPFFQNISSYLYPKLIIIEHSSKSKWDNDIIQWMIDSNYSLIYKNKGNSILQYKNN